MSESERLVCASAADRSAWTATYIVMGAILMLIFVVYVYFTRHELVNARSQPHGSFAAQLAYIIGLFSRGFGMIMSGVIIGNDWEWGKYSLFSSGLPGYVTAASYCFIFFSWCSVLVLFLTKQNDFYQKSRIALISLLLVISITFIVTVTFILAAPEKRTAAHWVEALFAMGRDLVIGVAFLLYMRKVAKMFEKPCDKCCSAEMNLMTVCVIMVVSLFIRAIAILVYVFVVRNSGGTVECSMEYLGAFILETAFGEFLPLIAIFAYKMGSLKETHQSHGNDGFISFG